MNEIDRARRVLRGVDGELDTHHLLDRVHALEREEPGPTVLIPLTEAAPTQRPRSRRRPRLALAAALTTACLAALAVIAVGVGGPWRDDAGAVQPGTSPAATATRTPVEPSPADERTLLRMIAGATVDRCLQAGARGSDKEYAIRLDDGTWAFAAESTRARSLDTAADFDRLVLTELARLVTHPGDRRSTSRETADGTVRVDVAPGVDSGLTELVLFVDPDSWRPTAVTGRTATGAETTLDVGWPAQCPPAGHE